LRIILHAGSTGKAAGSSNPAALLYADYSIDQGGAVHPRRNSTKTTIMETIVQARKKSSVSVIARPLLRDAEIILD
jgi:hypothetical protein